MSTIVCSRRATRVSQCSLPLYDFLAPYIVQSSPRSIASQQLWPVRRALSTTSPNLETAPSNSQSASQTPKPTLTKKALTQSERDFLTGALRVNQAGELAATLIYAAQLPPLTNSHPSLRPLLTHMYTQEAGHFATFNDLLSRHRIRPTAMYPVWTVAASALGWGTAMLGREAAMACTEAVETEIGEHYNSQVRVLLDMVKRKEESGEEVGEELRELVQTIRRIRDEELEHLDTAVENDAQEARPYALLTGVIRAGCRGAIWVSERI